MKSLSKYILGLATILVPAISAFAIPATLDIDFRSAGWQSAQGQPSYTVGGVTASAFRLNPQGAQFPSQLSANNVTGLAVDSTAPFQDPSELGPRELLSLSFLNASGADLTGVWLTKLFVEFFGATTDSGFVNLTLSDNSTLPFSFAGAQTSGQNPLGDYYLDFNGALDISKADFYANGLPIVNRDYAIAGFTRATTSPGGSVPDAGASFLLLGVAMITLALGRKLVN
jgi:hypothetical protein